LLAITYAELTARDCIQPADGHLHEGSSGAACQNDFTARALDLPDSG
jgi:hypothetical protein